VAFANCSNVLTNSQRKTKRSQSTQDQADFGARFSSFHGHDPLAAGSGFFGQQGLAEPHILSAVPNQSPKIRWSANIHHCAKSQRILTFYYCQRSLTITVHSD